MNRITPRHAAAAWLRRFLPLPLLAFAFAVPTGAFTPPPAWPDPGPVKPPPEMSRAAVEASKGPLRPGLHAKPVGTWRVLILIYRNMDVTSGTSHWQTAMSDGQVTMLLNACSNFAAIASTWSAGTGAVQSTTRIITRPLATLTPVFGSYYWITPDDVAVELEPELDAATYDSVVVLWHSGAVPTNYWGLAYVGPIGWHGHAFTWATVIKGEDWWWSRNDGPGETILHEWLHGLEGHFRNRSYVVPELHGAEEHGYTEDPVGGWRTWLRDYLQGKVPEPGRITGISPGVWGSGALNNQVDPAPCQLLSPLNGSDTDIPPSLEWAGPGSSFRMRLTNLADNSPAYELVTSTRSSTPTQHVLRTDGRYRWQAVSLANGVESAAPEGMSFHYTGAGVAYTLYQATQALQIAAGLGTANANWVGRLNIETSGPSAGQVDAIDAVRIVRKVAGLEANP